MRPSSRTPEGEPNRCPVCGNRLCLEPSVPPGDAPCPFCGVLLWFETSGDADFAELRDTRIRLRFRGGCRDGLIFAESPALLLKSHGHRYCSLALRGWVGMKWREVSVAQYGVISKVIEAYGPVQRLSNEEVRDIVHQLRELEVYVYEIARKEETLEEVSLTLDFLRVDHGL
jgi:hypothetical protein